MSSLHYVHSGGGLADDSNESVPNVTVTMNASDQAAIQQGFGLRLAPYSILAASCCLFNVLSLAAIANIRGRRSVYHTLLLNLASCDICGSALLWMYYNSPALFPLFKKRTMLDCLFVLMVVLAPFILSLCCSTLALFMLGVNQYLAICQPFFSTTKVTKRRVSICVCLTWAVSLFLAVLPAITMVVKVQSGGCVMYTSVVSNKTIEVCSYFLAAMIVFIVCLYARIYREIVLYRRRTPKLSGGSSMRCVSLVNGRSVRRSETDAEKNYKAFITTLLLSGTLVMFWLPYFVFHFISAHLDFNTTPQILIDMKFYLFDFMPMLTFLTDPIIYGIRMREIREGYKRLFHRIFPCCVDEPRRRNFKDSVRFSTLESNI